MVKYRNYKTLELLNASQKQNKTNMKKQITLYILSGNRRKIYSVEYTRQLWYIYTHRVYHKPEESLDCFFPLPPYQDK